MTPSQPSFLVIRRDNIGDLVCTTPLITALRSHFPESWIGALVNRYAVPVLENNPHVSAVVSYEKAKHRAPGDSLVAGYLERFRLLRGLRRRAIDYVLLAAPGRQESAERMARWVKPRHVIGFQGGSPVVDTPAKGPGDVVHQVVRAFSLLQPLGIEGAPPPLQLRASPSLEAAARRQRPANRKAVVGVHISAREADRRWPDDRFQTLVERLCASGAGVILTWAPGTPDNPLFPGDDASAKRLMSRWTAPEIVAMATPDLRELIASLAACDYVICSDGGVVHLAAALNKPVLCFFGHEDARLWHPWGVPYELLQTPSRRAEDITVEQAWEAWQRLSTSTAS